MKDTPIFSYQKGNYTINVYDFQVFEICGKYWNQLSESDKQEIKTLF